MCDAPSTAVYCTEPIEWYPLLYFYFGHLLLFLSLAIQLLFQQVSQPQFNWIELLFLLLFLKPISQFLCVLVLFIILSAHSSPFLPQIQLNRTALCKYWGTRSFHKFPFHSYNIVFAVLFNMSFVITCCLCVSVCCLYLLFLLSLCCCVSTHKQ
jgi:hypothetical protein